MKVTTKKILAFLCAGLMLIQSAGTVVFADDAVSVSVTDENYYTLSFKADGGISR